jgi:hypothetical protein
MAVETSTGKPRQLRGFGMRRALRRNFFVV